jgi:hypothetical protein
VCLLLLLGCSSNDESSKPAKEQCQDFESSYCSKVVECAQSTDRGDFKELCDFSWRVYLPCDNVDSAVSVQPCLPRSHQRITAKSGERERWATRQRLGVVRARPPANAMKNTAIDLSHPLEFLSAAREQMRLSLHLLSLDARQKWDELEGKILSLENKIGQEAESASESTASAAIDLTGSVKAFVDSHVRHIDH